MEHEKSIKQIINDSLDQVRSIIDADTVIGKEIETLSGTVIIPISKVSIGFVSGGLDMPNPRTRFKDFGGGGGTGVTVTPVGFLTVYPNGHTELLNLAPSQTASALDEFNDILNHTPIIIDKVKNILEEATEPSTPVYLNERERRKAKAEHEKRLAKKEREREKERRRNRR